MARRKLFTLKNKRHMPTWLAWILASLIKLIAATYRVTVKDPHGCHQLLLEKNFVIVLWHNRILFMAPLAGKAICRRSHALISASRDGEYVSTFIRFFGITPVRGSSSRGGARALLELCHLVKSGRNVVVTVDGPRGPRYEVHSGSMMISRRGGVPMVPVSINAERKWQLKSWDRMQIPKPFSRVELIFGAPWMPAETEEDPARLMRERLMEITKD